MPNLEYISLLGLKILQKVVELGSFRAAAKSLQISQPAVSDHIHRIEKLLEVQLFERPYRRKLHLTEAGQLLYKYAIDISAKNREVLGLLEDVTKGNIGRIKFALSIGTTLFSPIIASYIRMHPDVSVLIRSSNSIEVINLVRQGIVDFGITQKIERNSDFTYQTLYKEPMILFCAKSYPLANKKTISIEDLVKHGIITCLEKSDYYYTINNYLYCLGIRREHLVQVENGSLILKLVSQGGGLGILPRSTLKDAFEQNKIVKLTLKEGVNPPNLIYQLIFRNNTLLNRATDNFLCYLREEVAKIKLKQAN